MLLYKRTISQFQVILTKPTNAGSTLLPHQINFAIYTFGFWGGRGGGESQINSFSLFNCAAAKLRFSCVYPDKKTLKLVIKVNRVERFSTVELFLMF